MVASSVTFGLSLNELSTKAFYESIHEKKKIIGRFATKNVAAYQTDYIIEKLVSLQTRPNTSRLLLFLVQQKHNPAFHGFPWPRRRRRYSFVMKTRMKAGSHVVSPLGIISDPYQAFFSAQLGPIEPFMTR